MCCVTNIQKYYKMTAQHDFSSVTVMYSIENFVIYRSIPRNGDEEFELFDFEDCQAIFTIMFFEHACECPVTSNCEIELCDEQKEFILHYKLHRKETQCSLCRYVFHCCLVHASGCLKKNCQVINCNNLRSNHEKVRRLFLRNLERANRAKIEREIYFYHLRKFLAENDIGVAMQKTVRAARTDILRIDNRVLNLMNMLLSEQRENVQ